MHQKHTHYPSLPLPLPDCPIERGVLVIARRTAIHGLQDAEASFLAIRIFKTRFRRPLALIRCLVHEIAAASKRSIKIAPCCTPGMTLDEGLLLGAICGDGLPSLLGLTDNDDCGSTLPVAQMLSEEINHSKMCSLR
ncbi:DUF6628 family protein [Qipengyuania sp. DGS5-3]|uniref:DUF6628 family protein n=1 Tax=Qipengyuania sp. DGS5-3 TaxID=3349632 RepID=UPI0036D327F7